jgi:hypothetical protein
MTMLLPSSPLLPTPPLSSPTGDPYCGSCSVSTAYGTFPNCQLCPTMFGTPCGNGEDRGECDASSGCKCNTALHFKAGKTGNCDSCETGYWGLSCSACPPCSSNGQCDGSGTGSGSGQCVCAAGWTGTLCDKAAVDGGAIAAGVIFGLLGAAAIGVFVYARFFGGAPKVAAAWAATTGAAASALSAVTTRFGGERAERSALLRTSPATSSARFTPIGAGGASESGAV